LFLIKPNLTIAVEKLTGNDKKQDCPTILSEYSLKKFLNIIASSVLPEEKLKSHCFRSVGSISLAATFNVYSLGFLEYFTSVRQLLNFYI